MLVIIITMLIREVQLYSTFFTTNNTIKASLMTAPQLTPDTNKSCCFLLLLEQYSWTVSKLILWAYKNKIVWGGNPYHPTKGTNIILNDRQTKRWLPKESFISNLNEIDQKMPQALEAWEIEGIENVIQWTYHIF